MLLAGKSRSACWLLCFGLAAASHAAPVEIRFKEDKVIVISEETTREFLSELKARPVGTLHGLVALPAHPGLAERGALQSAGLHVLSPVHSTIYRVRVEAKWLDSRTETQSLPAVMLTRLKADQRVDPELRTAPAAQKTVDVTVRIHKGTADQQLAGFLQKIPQSEKQSDEVWLVTLTRESLWELAEDDVVQWIDKGPPLFQRENDVTRKAVRADSVQKWKGGQVRGLGGQNVQVGLFELGIDEEHKDVGPRVRRSADMPIAGQPSHHATLLAAIIAGDGTMSDKEDSHGAKNKGQPFQWRGMAPKAELLDINRRRPNGPNGANAAIHLNFINKLGMDISNHSYGVNTDGSYDNSNQARDQLIRGDASSEGEPVPARLHVTSAGNRAAYFGLTKQMKNALVVSNWSAIAKKLHKSSSIGPTLDGRIKPDVVAPGTAITSAGFCPGGFHLETTSVLACEDRSVVPVSYLFRQNFYATIDVGTSQAAAVTTGALALVLEKYVRTYKVALDWNPPLPSTLRAVMIHTARDRQSATSWFDLRHGPVWPKQGPDFATGWGLIDTHAAVRAIGARHLLEDAVTATCEEIEYSFVVPRTGKGRVRVTLAWDDVAADPALEATVPKLVNDLDLVLIDPRGKPHYPWQLDQKMENSRASCGSTVAIKRGFEGDFKNVLAAPVLSALRGPDHLNNVEVVDAPRKAGRWRVRVLAFNIPQGPQRFSLVGATFEKIGGAIAAVPDARVSAPR